MIGKTIVCFLFWENKNQVLTFNGLASNIPGIDLSRNAQHPIPLRHKNLPRLSFLACKAPSGPFESQSVVLILVPGPV